MTKAERLEIEDKARLAAGRAFRCSPIRDSRPIGSDGQFHEFDIFCRDVVVGGVTTSPLSTGGGNRNTGGCDRAASELLWMTLWPGSEVRVHVLTDKPLAERLVRRYRTADFPHPISIYHFDIGANKLDRIGILQAPVNPSRNKRPKAVRAQ